MLHQIAQWHRRVRRQGRQPDDVPGRLVRRLCPGHVTEPRAGSVGVHQPRAYRVHFSARLRATSSGETLQIDTTVVQQQALPVLLILGALARLGIKYAIGWYGKTQVKKAVKSYLLNNISASKLAHIMAPKHNWSAVGARSREQVAELMGRAMAESKHIPYGTSGSSMMARWQHAGRTIEVTYAKNGGKVSNGWVVG